jgi:hypothetical protein
MSRDWHDAVTKLGRWYARFSGIRATMLRYAFVWLRAIRLCLRAVSLYSLRGVCAVLSCLGSKLGITTILALALLAASSYFIAATLGILTNDSRELRLELVTDCASPQIYLALQPSRPLVDEEQRYNEAQRSDWTSPPFLDGVAYYGIHGFGTDGLDAVADLYVLSDSDRCVIRAYSPLSYFVTSDPSEPSRLACVTDESEQDSIYNVEIRRDESTRKEVFVFPERDVVVSRDRRGARITILALSKRQTSSVPKFPIRQALVARFVFDDAIRNESGFSSRLPLLPSQLTVSTAVSIVPLLKQVQEDDEQTVYTVRERPLAKTFLELSFFSEYVTRERFGEKEVLFQSEPDEKPVLIFNPDEPLESYNAKLSDMSEAIPTMNVAEATLKKGEPGTHFFRTINFRDHAYEQRQNRALIFLSATLGISITMLFGVFLQLLFPDRGRGVPAR